MPRISSKNQITLPTVVLDEAGLHAGDEVSVEALSEGQIVVRRGRMTFENALGALTGVFPAGYLEQLDREEEEER